jgi:hypothetical protein
VTGPPVRTRAFVVILAAWMALASAAVVTVGPPSIAAFAVLGVGLVAVTTLYRSIRWGAAAAVASLLVIALAAGTGPIPPWSFGADDLVRLLRSLVRWPTLVVDLLAALALGGTAALAELASAGLEWDHLLRGTVGGRRPADEEMEPADTRPWGARNGAALEPSGEPEQARQQEEP